MVTHGAVARLIGSNYPFSLTYSRKQRIKRAMKMPLISSGKKGLKMARKALRKLRKHTSRILVKASTLQKRLSACASSELCSRRRFCSVERLAHF